MNSINAKSVQLIELHAFAYCLLSVSLSESFDFLKISILHIISMLSSIILLTGTAIHISPRLCATLLCTTLSIHFSTCSLESSIDFCHSSINSSQILSLIEQIISVCTGRIARTFSIGKATDASARYVKGVDEYSTVLGMKRALHLMEELGCGKVSRTHFDVNTGNSIDPTPMTVSVSKVNGVLGIEVPEAEILRIMKNLNFAPEINGDELTIQVPAYREDMLPEGENDVERYPDVAEEVIRMYGYDHITSTFLPSAKVTIGGSNLRQRTILKVKRTLCSVGAFEGIHYSFFSPSDLDEMGFAEDAPERRAIRIMNPINEDLSLMRTTLAPQMIHAMGRNQKRGIFEGRIFEIGNAFIPKSLPLTEYPEERETLCIGAFGKEESFFTLKVSIPTSSPANRHITYFPEWEIL